MRHPIGKQIVGLAIDSAARPFTYVTPGWPGERLSNGIVTYTRNLRQALESKDYRVRLITIHGDGANDPAVSVLHYLYNEPNHMWRLVGKARRRMGGQEAVRRMQGAAILREVKRLYRQGEISTVEIPDTFGLAKYVARGSPVPVVVRLHGPWILNGKVAQNVPEDTTYRRRVTAEGLGIECSPGVTAPSKDVLDRVREFYQLPLRRAEVIPNPVKPVAASERWCPGLCDRKRILFVGRFDRHKGGDVILDAFATLAKRHPDSCLTFVGRDKSLIDDHGRRWTLQQFLQDRFPDRARRSRVQVLGQQSNTRLDDLRRRALVTVVPSRYEVSGYTVLEAMALGAPLVSTNVGGIPEVVQHERNGLLAQGGNAEDLADKIGSLLENPHFAAKLGQQAREDCSQRHHPDIIARRTVEFYQRVIDRRESRIPNGDSECSP